jgi:hypothetical protein
MHDTVGARFSDLHGCTVPLDIGDGRYYLVSVTVVANQSRRTFSWLGDLPSDPESDPEIHVEGGPTGGLPNIKSIQITGPVASKR